MEEMKRKNRSKTIVKILDYNPANHTVRVVKAKDNQPLEEDVWVAKKIEQEKIYDQKVSKTIKSSDEAEAAILEVEDRMVSIRGSSQNGFFSTRDSGNIIKGPLSIEAEPHEIRLSGLTKLNPLITSGFASSIVTPIPVTIFDLPGAGVITRMAKDIATIAPLLSIGAL